MALSDCVFSYERKVNNNADEYFKKVSNDKNRDNYQYGVSNCIYNGLNLANSGNAQRGDVPTPDAARVMGGRISHSGVHMNPGVLRMPKPNKSYHFDNRNKKANGGPIDIFKLKFL